LAKRKTSNSDNQCQASGEGAQPHDGQRQTLSPRQAGKRLPRPWKQPPCRTPRIERDHDDCCHQQRLNHEQRVLEEDVRYCREQPQHLIFSRTALAYHPGAAARLALPPCGYNHVVKSLALTALTVLLALGLGGCNRGGQSKEAVRAAILDAVRAFGAPLVDDASLLVARYRAVQPDELGCDAEDMLAWDAEGWEGVP
jgi:hypothetical protein